MEVTAVKSKVVRWIRYDEINRILDVAFVPSGEYRYFDVERDVFEWLCRVRSKGSFINRLVRGKYRYERIDQDEAPVKDGDLEQLLRDSLRSPSKDKD